MHCYVYCITIINFILGVLRQLPLEDVLRAPLQEPAEGLLAAAHAPDELAGLLAVEAGGEADGRLQDTRLDYTPYYTTILLDY